jgi:hypothetical protein
MKSNCAFWMVWCIFGVTPAGAQEARLLGTFRQAGVLDFGYSIASGDFNGDGYSDILVGAFDDTSHYGSAHIFLGGATPDTAADLVLRCPDTTMVAYAGGFGNAVAGIGDFNGDGYEDWVIGAPNHGGYYLGWPHGEGYLYLGGLILESTADLSLPGEGCYWRLGYSLAGADLNSDGYSDLVAGAPCGIVDGEGHVVIYYGAREPFSVSYGWRVDGPHLAESGFGSSVVCGDFDGDERPDLLVGAPYAFHGQSDSSGEAFVFLNDPLDSVPDLQLRGREKGFGEQAACGDLNGDGCADIVLGPLPYCAFLGGATIDSVTDWLPGMPSSAVASLACGDVNNDGYADILLGMTASESDGLVRIYLGGTELDAEEDVVIWSEQAEGSAIVAVVGDVNGDGWMEFAVAVREQDQPYPERSVLLYTLNPEVGTAEVTDDQPIVQTAYLRSIPNPCAGSSLVQYETSSGGQVTLSVFSMDGRLMKTLWQGVVDEGSHQVGWRAEKGLPAGVYLLRLRTETGTATSRAVILR